jgi:hypothetical protein
MPCSEAYSLYFCVVSSRSWLFRWFWIKEYEHGHGNCMFLCERVVQKQSSITTQAWIQALDYGHNMKDISSKPKFGKNLYLTNDKKTHFHVALYNP